MKILSPEEEREHYNATLYGGTLGGLAGVGAGSLGVWAASQRYPAFRTLSIPFRAFLITSTGTFSAIVSADSYSRHFERSRNPQKQYKDEDQTLMEQANAQKSSQQRAMAWLSENRYSVVFGSWVASMSAALGLGLTIAVVIISLAFETTDNAKGEGRWETVKIIDPNDPTHKNLIEKRIHHERYAGEDQWRDMIAAEEERMKERDEAVRAQEQEDKKKGKKESHHEGNGSKKGSQGKQQETKEKKVNAP